MKRTVKILKAFFLVVISFLVIGSTVLGVHIYQVTGKADNMHMANVAMGRIDFDKALDSIAYPTIQTFLKEQQGVRHTYLNKNDGILVFGYHIDEVDKTALFDLVIEQFGPIGTLYQIDEDQVANSCPVIDRHSFAGRVSSGFQKLFAYWRT
jgi:hypothetical protein